jgi:hypothetical protein
MNSKKFLLTAATAVAALICSEAVLAGKCSGTNINNLVSWDQTEISKGSTSVTVSDDASAPWHLVSGECIGSFLMTPDGKTQAGGHCARRDKDGDALYEEWISTGGVGDKGSLRQLGGTGKFAKASGTAQWEFTPLQGKMGSVRWVGNCP